MRSVTRYQCLSVCPSVVFGLSFESLELEIAFWYAGTSEQYPGQVRISR